MAKLTISRVFESSKTLATKTGQEIREFIQYTCDVAEQSLRALRNGLTFQDNFKCQIITVNIKTASEQVINTQGKQPFGINIVRVTADSPDNAGYSSFQWWLNAKGETTIKVGITGSPTTEVDVTLVIFFT